MTAFSRPLQTAAAQYIGQAIQGIPQKIAIPAAGPGQSLITQACRSNDLPYSRMLLSFRPHIGRQTLYVGASTTTQRLDLCIMHIFCLAIRPVFSKKPPLNTMAQLLR
ncbi:hypothetical protein DS878_06500 [Marinobacter sp. F3R11]|nr:hypothetical protein DS878_06500 [Marinobacter sp. F3R11]